MLRHGPRGVSPVSTVLVVDDDPHVRMALRELLEGEGAGVMEAGDGKTALDLLGRHAVDLMLLDLELPRVSGIEVLEHIAASRMDVAVVIISGRGSIRKAVATTKLGAHDFLEKPVDGELAIRIVRDVLSRTTAKRVTATVRAGLRDPCGIVGSSAAIRTLFEQLVRSAATDAKVLIVGESGTGKEIAARAIHANGSRRAGVFVAVNCAAIPETLIETELFGHERGAFTGAQARRRGRVEQAHGGTLFLDEIGDMSLMTQAKILRVIEDGRFQRVGGDQEVSVDCRVIAATNRDLETAVRQGDFRGDLFYRLNVIRIELPPLRARCEDIPDLAESFIKAQCLKEGLAARRLTAGAQAALMSHPWPGNVRELRNVTERLLVLGYEGPIEAAEVRSVLGTPVPESTTAAAAGFRAARAEFERAFIQRALTANGGRIQDTAQELGIDRTYLWKKMKRLGVG
ncbi:MAG TPA: sigma-54 dependent transcriptional regulator [Gemmatimonadaceae bacterium]|nr:sigma-54 dependent transcriptional regulator [Gemmatimonadaceae bacterium]